MAFSKEWTNWHLTEKGWVRGCQKTDFGTTNSTTPEDTLLTYQYTQKMTSIEVDETVQLISNHQCSSKMARVLMNTYGPCPNHL